MTLEIDKLYTFTVVEELEYKDAVIIKDEFGQTHYYPYKYTLGETIQLMVVKFENGKYFFSPYREIPQYLIGSVHTFEVLKFFRSKNGVPLFEVLDKDKGVSAIVKAFDDQLPPNMPNTVLCKVVDVDPISKRVKIYQTNISGDSIFQDGESYDFSYIGKSEHNNDYIEVKGIDGKIYSLIHPLKLRRDELKHNDIIRYVCSFENGISKFRYFVRFEDIIKYRVLKNNTFEALKNSVGDIAKKLYKDYSSQNNLWILSFCSLLQEEYNISISNKEYERALMLGEVLVDIEYWILNSGFLKTFKENVEEKEIYARGIYDKYIIRTKALDILLNERHLQYLENLCVEIKSIQDINNNSIIDKIEIVQYVFNLDRDLEKTVPLLELYFQYVKLLGDKCFFIYNRQSIHEKIVKYLKFIIRGIEQNDLSKVFLNRDAMNSYYHNNQNVKIYLQSVQILILILKDQLEFKEANLYTLVYVKTQSILLDLTKSENTIIQLALKFSLCNYDENHPFLPLWKDNECDFNDKLFGYMHQLRSISINKISTLNKKLRENQVIEGRILDEDRYGYVIDLFENKSILPINWIVNSSIMDLNVNPNRLINVWIKRLDEKFGRILCSNNLNQYTISKQQNLDIGNTVEGKVKRFEDYGAFIDLGSDDGLVHLQEMSFNHVNHPSELLRIGEIHKFKILDIRTDEKGKTLIDLSIKGLKPVPVGDVQKGQNYEARIIRVLPDKLYIEILETGDFGIVSSDLATWDSTLDILKFYKEGDKIIVRLYRKNGKSLVFSIKDSTKNPYSSKSILQKTFSGTVVDINQHIITIKSLELSLYVTYRINEDSPLLDIGDIVQFTIISVVNGIIYVDINDLNKINIEYNYDNIDGRINEEIGHCYELYAMQLADIDHKHNYLEWAKYFFSLANSAKSYYLNLYISYQEVIKLSYVKASNEVSIDDKIYCVIEKSKMLIKEIEEKELTTQIYPLLKQIKITLEIICLFGENNQNSMAFLLNIIHNEVSFERSNHQLAKIVLSYNLIASEITDHKIKKEKWILIHNILKEGLLNINNIPTVNENQSKLLELIQEDESRVLEFKSSLFTPIPDKNKRSLIVHFNEERKIALENNNSEKLSLIEEKINDLSNNNAQKAVIHSAMKTLVAFANSDGGDLILGLEDNKNILGLEFDFSSLNKKDNQFDSFRLRFDQYIGEYIGTDFNNLLEDAKFVNIDNQNLYWVKVKKSKTAVFLKKDEKGNNTSDVWVRAQASSNKVTKAEELQKFFRQFS